MYLVSYSYNDMVHFYKLVILKNYKTVKYVLYYYIKVNYKKKKKFVNITFKLYCNY